MTPTRPLAFRTVTTSECHSCGREKYVLMANVDKFPPTCVICLFATIDVPMTWKLSRTAIQTLAHREASADIHAEQERMESMLPPELRSKKRIK